MFEMNCELKAICKVFNFELTLSENALFAATEGLSLETPSHTVILRLYE